MYFEKVFRENIPKDREVLSEKMTMSEFMFLGLRLLRGIDLNMFNRRFGKRAEDVYSIQIARLLEQGLIEARDGCLRLSVKGLPLANRVFREFV